MERHSRFLMLIKVPGKDTAVATQFNATAAQIQAALLTTGGSITATQSGQFTVEMGVPVTTPEPGTAALLLLSCAPFLLFAGRRRTSGLPTPSA